MPNRLQKEFSPYLLQHAHNPVDWYPWGEEALQKAKEENKLILVSIGYAACHWCHVMEHESFEDESIADFMNEHFVNIKVDREERPDIDKIYMDAVMLMTQRGGWPLNAIALPDGRPIYGGTYFPPEHWLSVLEQVSETWNKEPERTKTYARDLAHAMNSMDIIDPTQPKGSISEEEFDSMMTQWMGEIDPEWGGRKVNANKFPLPQNNLFLLRAAFYFQNQGLWSLVENNLEKMAFGGIYDQIGGGFARYSVDAYWKVPHFEKMLYDNGQLLSLYSEAYMQSPRPLYKRVIEQTIEFVQRELTSPDGAFYAALDADSEGEEGKFYVWEFEEIKTLLGEHYKSFTDYHNIQPEGNWEGKNIPFVLETEEEFAEKWEIDADQFSEEMVRARKVLLEARASRIRPALDHKILTSWNAMMIKGLIEAYRALGEQTYLKMAIQAAKFMEQNLLDEDRLYRSYQGDKGEIPGFLDDYAHALEAWISLYQVTFEEKWLDQALKWQAYIQDHFWLEDLGLYAYTSDEDPILVKRKIERQDDVIPSSNAVMAQSLFLLGKLTGQQSYVLQAREMLEVMKAELLHAPSWHAKWMQLVLQEKFTFYEIAIVGKEAMSYLSEMYKVYYPHKVTMGTESQSSLPLLKDKQPAKTTLYVCEGYVCNRPVEKVDEAIAQIMNGR